MLWHRIDEIVRPYYESEYYYIIDRSYGIYQDVFKNIWIIETFEIRLYSFILLVSRITGMCIILWIYVQRFNKTIHSKRNLGRYILISYFSNFTTLYTPICPTSKGKMFLLIQKTSWNTRAVVSGCRKTYNRIGIVNVKSIF